MTQPTVKLHRLSLSATKLQALPPDELYVFALAGHVFNELMLLQKMVITSTPPPGAHPFVQDAGVARAVFSLRLLVGKTHEAIKALSKQSVDVVLRDRFLTRVIGLDARWQAAREKHDTMPWLVKIRNQRAFHYMNKEQWLPHITPELIEGAYVIVGTTYGNTLFQWQEFAAGLPMLKLVDEDDPLEGGLGEMLDTMGGLLSDLGSCLAEALQVYMHEVLTDEGALADAEHVPADSISAVTAPYFHLAD
ncbi:hypothetical protein [Hydrogenophaga sp.]|uniref:hypothetical protein n=1 Tax=Hydrogenophaga sp. TaxID=1904254 RepID=UPI0026232B80|nr:hypothetical protein [Hydrogenophaga sp.]MDM7950092.1 hypothetical protein [Hydrogenophaga sp.]